VQAQYSTASAILIKTKLARYADSLVISFNNPQVLSITHVVFLILPHHQLQTCLKRGGGIATHTHMSKPLNLAIPTWEERNFEKGSAGH
jgi:hypothetical protein